MSTTGSLIGDVIVLMGLIGFIGALLFLVELVLIAIESIVRRFR